MTRTHIATLVLDARARLGEGALWDFRRQRLLWVDINGHSVHLFDPETGADRVYPAESTVGTVVPESSGHALAAVGRGLSLLDLDTGSWTPFGEPFESDDNRLNDGKCDPQGRLWVGGISRKGVRNASKLWSIDHTGVATVRKESVHCSNGIVWSKDSKRMFYIDTGTNCLEEFHFDPQTGAIEHARLMHPFTHGHPDGSTIDADGGIWVALWDGWSVVRVDSESGEVTDQIEVPAQFVTSCAFGGPNLDRLYITCARDPVRKERALEQPNAGGVFVADVGRCGVRASVFARTQA